LVTLWDVLEHLPNPRQEIQEIVRVLEVGGVLVVRVPNTNFQLAKALCRERLLKKEPTSLQANLHLSHFTSGSLRLLPETSGLSVFKEEAGVSDDKVHGGDAPLWVNRLYCSLSSAALALTSIQTGPTFVQYTRKTQG